MNISNALIEFDYLVLQKIESGYAALTHEPELKRFAQTDLPGMCSSVGIDFSLIKSSKEARAMLVQKEQELAKLLADKSMYTIFQKCTDEEQQYMYNIIHSMILLNHIHECHRTGITLPNKNESKLSNKFCEQSDGDGPIFVEPLPDFFLLGSSNDLLNVPEDVCSKLRHTLLVGEEGIVEGYANGISNKAIIPVIYSCLYLKIKGFGYTPSTSADYRISFDDSNYLKQLFNRVQDNIDKGDHVLNIIEMLNTDEYLDAVMSLYNDQTEFASKFRLLKSIKNRYGSLPLLTLYTEWEKERVLNEKMPRK